MEKARVRVVVSGRVQGVCFRAYTQDEAKALGLSGWVRNLADGRVELVAEGPAEKVRELVTWCHRGPPWAKVDSVDVTDEEPRGESGGFGIRR